MHRMLTGKLPEWPYVWPFSGNDRLRKHLHADVAFLIRKSTEFDAKRRYKDAGRMLAALNRIKHPLKSNRRSVSKRSVQTGGWKTVRYREFQRQFGKMLETRHKCGKCGGPVSEPMACCPWCGKARKQHPDEEIRFSISCPRCHRGLKSDWRYCAWCFGSGFDPSSNTLRPPLRKQMFKFPMRSEDTDGFHALLSMVSDSCPTQMENPKHL